MITRDGVQQVGEAGSLLGAFPDAHLRDAVVPFPQEATLVVYTDGVTDAVGAGGDRFGVERLRETLDRCRTCSADEVIGELVGSLEQFQIGSHADDTAAVVIRRLDGDAEPRARELVAQTGSSGSER